MKIKNEYWFYFMGTGLIIGIIAERIKLVSFWNYFLLIIISIFALIYGLILYLRLKKQNKE